MEYNDEEIAVGIKNGSPELFCFLYEKYFSSLNRFSFHIVMREESKDVVHDVFSKLWENKKSLPDDVNIKSYLYSAVKNKSLDFLKHKGVEDKNQKKLMESIFFVEDSWCEDDEQLYEKLMKCVAKLPPQQQSVMKLKIEGKSYNEISEMLSISSKTVNNHMVKIYNFIRANLYIIIYLGVINK